MTDLPRADIGVIGGSGLYSFLDDVTEVPVTTPYGPPSDALLVGEYAGRTIAFLPRHGRSHSVPPHRINYRANLWALRSVGVRRVLAPCAVGSLDAELGPGTLVVPDQVIDRTYGRENTYFDGLPREDGTFPPVAHAPMADPYCSTGRETVIATAREQGWPPHPEGTLVVIQGPRFSTRAESLWHRAAGGTVVGMTGQPEAALARELGLCYTSIALVTDLDAGAETGEGVTHEEVLAVFRQNIDRLRPLLTATIKNLPGEDACACPDAPDAEHV
ncbi:MULTISPECIES: S-methyl-5'-thioadenosine phosphorylase [Streptomyces]|jgi:5'-methylthioadenosine phosphorylase|uniref:Purine nucleoside phosphorylase n=2 Tax=Streptomyces TaxID=1883 RepID=A0A142C6V5_9ACTN|nr:MULTISPECIES: S-methyl-5'-thioadenosine phosphorylase [Streptomyces]AMP46607.1 putative nucleoside phosphorylase [Streptomyces calvus]MBA8944403.1 5'-methylthioadenosine phosphorylase [Streptomyces calvus]MBA8976765.1 5'-methylthioadenosine phosphorylase [Streptomyces calvus]MYS29778.1 S-methyl-5'-thioadenosine phosphorylase [Streptomyces sp. SID7804]GGP55364.1 purine nucleoside phosphorylase [Streptomyces calvus]